MSTPPTAIVAEPSPALGEAIADTLEVLGFDAVVVPNEEKAADAIARLGEPDLLVCDAGFGAEPKPYAYVRTTIARAPLVPVVITSTPDMPVPADLKGRMAFAEKPFGKQQLLDGVDAAKKLAADSD
jgi:DNA-binding NtrC family response regulator